MTDLYRFWNKWPLRLCLLLKVTAYPVIRRRMTLLSGVGPVRKRMMKMIRDQSPGVALRLGFFEDDGQAVEEGAAVLIVSEKLRPFDSPGHDVLDEAGGV